MKAKSILGIILVGLGILLLAYFAFPLRLIVSETFGRLQINPFPVILGGVALVWGLILLRPARPKAK